MLVLILTYALFASAFSVNKAILGISSPVFLAGIRTLISGAILSIYSYGTKKYSSLDKKSIIALAQVAIFTIFLHAVLKNFALKNMSSIKTGFFHNLDPFVAALYAYLIFSEKLSKRKWLGMLIAFMGAVIYLFASSPAEQSIGEIAFLSIPELSILASIAIGRLGWFKTQYLVRDRGYSPPFITGVSMLCGGIMSLCASYFMESGPRVTDYKMFSIYLTYMVISSNIIGYNLYAYLHRKHSGTLIALVGFLQPLMVAFYGIVFLGEFPTWHYFISTIMVFIGVGVFYRDEINSQFSE